MIETSKQMKQIFAFLILVLVSAFPAVAEVAEVAAGIRITKKSYPVPANEQPFFGFVGKTATQVLADEKFITQIIASAGTRERALDETLRRGWSALASGDLVVAGRRFNQAYLIAPDRSEIYHAFAALTQTRFDDTEYAEELFRIALKRPGALKTLHADYGRLLLIAKRPIEARSVLEQAVIEAPRFGDAWSNLALARLQTGDGWGACAAAAEAEKLFKIENEKFDIALVKREAKC